MFERNYDSTNFITGMRAYAVLMVFLVHCNYLHIQDLNNILSEISNVGRYGVEIFFVISGFTIFYQLYEKKYKPFDFISLRFIRLSILYYPILLFSFVVIYLGYESGNSWLYKFNETLTFTNLFFHISYLSIFDIKYMNSIIGVEWSLFIEVAMYFIIFILASFKFKFTLKKLIFLTSIFFLLRIVLSKYFDPIFFNWFVIKYIYMFLLGGLAYMLRKKYIEKNISGNIVFFITVCLFIIIGMTFKTNELLFVIFSFILLVIVKDTDTISKIFLNNKIILYIGSISYSFYLNHYIVIKYDMFKIGILSNFIGFNIIYHLILTIVISTLTYFVFEVILYRKIKRIFKRRNI